MELHRSTCNGTHRRIRHHAAPRGRRRPRDRRAASVESRRLGRERTPGARAVSPAEVAVFVAIAVTLATVSCLPTPADGVSVPTVTRAVRVQASDTLWTIARRHALPGSSTARTVGTIRDMNDLEPSDVLQPGSYVRVPYPDTGHSALARR